MTGEEILNKSMKLCGVVTSQGNAELNQRIRSSALDNINIVYADLKKILGEEFTPVSSLDTKIELPDIVIYDCFIYGLAMHISRSEYDTDNQREFAIIYNQKRAGLTSTGKIVDGIPRSVNL